MQIRRNIIITYIYLCVNWFHVIISTNKITLSGQILLGGIFPIHQKGTKGYSPTDHRAGELCGALNKDRGVQRVEAMLFAIDKVNKDPTLLPNITIGAIVLDTCSSDTYALNQSLEFIRASINTAFEASAFECDISGAKVRPRHGMRNIYGVVGGSYSEVSLQVANLLRLFRIPQISYASTSIALSDKKKYEFFARTVPSDKYQAKALIDLVEFFNWTYVSLVSSEGQYGESGSSEFTFLAKARNICVAVHEKVAQSGDETRYDLAMENLLRDTKARAVVLFLRMEDAKGLLRAAKRANATDTYIWIASDGWGKELKVVEDAEQVAQGALTLELSSSEIVEFNQYFSKLDVNRHNDNPWFKEFWQETFKCSLPMEQNDLSLPECSPNLRLDDLPFRQESKVQFVIDAVYAFAHAIHSAWVDLCHGEAKVCNELQALDPAVFYNDYLLKVKFKDLANTTVEFDSNGDGLGRYSIYNFKRLPGSDKYGYEEVGLWTKEGMEINLSAITWDSYMSYELPRSVCSEPCKVGEVKRGTGASCCWICQECKPWEYAVNDSCKPCDEGFWPHVNKSSCFELPLKYIHWYQPYAFIPGSIAVIGIVAVFYHFVIFIQHVNTPIVKASGRELCYVLLGGILFCHIMTFVIMAKPMYATCLIQRFGIGLCISIIYGAILTKTNRISRIFQNARRSARRPTCISPASQLCITGGIVAIQIGLNLLWCVLEKPGIRKVVTEKRNEVILKCAVSKNSVLISLIYGLLLVATCTYYAFKTRKIPENFNETKFIVFTMYATCIIWIAFLAIYLSTGNNFEIQLTTLAMSVSLSGYVALICLFSPKIYIILRHPDKNVRKLTMNNATYKKSSTGPPFGQETPPSYSPNSPAPNQRATPAISSYGSCNEPVTYQLDSSNLKKRSKGSKHRKTMGKEDKSKIIQEDKNQDIPLHEMKESNKEKEKREQENLEEEDEEDEENQRACNEIL